MILDHRPKGKGQRGRDQQHSQYLQEISQRRRILERMGGVGIEEAASVGSQELDGILRGRGTKGDDLLSAFKAVRDDVGVKSLHNALRGKYQ